MKATANVPVVVASSSTNSNRSMNPNMSANMHGKPVWTFTPLQPNTTMPLLPIRPVNSATVNQMPVPSPQRPVNSAPIYNNRVLMVNPNLSDVSNRPNTSHSSVDPNNPSVFTPRRRKNKGGENPRAAQTPPNTTGVQVPLDAQSPAATGPQEPRPGRILVTGFPLYTQAHDLLELFSKFGNVRIEKCNGYSATLSFSSEEQARRALGANRRTHVYGHFLSVRPAPAGNYRAGDEPPSPKRDFPRTKQNGVILDPAKLDLSGDFHAQLDMILAAIRLNQDDINRISTLYRDLENAFQGQWPGCKAIPFGSITTGLGIKSSDADCFMSLPRGSGGACPVSRARRVLAAAPRRFAELLAIPRANTPILKFHHVPTNTNCDLTFKTPLGAQNSRLIAFLLNADPRITPVAVLIKYWAKVHELSGTGKLTNYALTMMIIFYLQQPPLSLLPSVEWLQRDRTNDVYVDFWNTGFMNDVNRLPPITNTSTISELLGGFFEYYSIFNFEEMMVCPYLGTPVKKELFRDLTTIPDDFKLYKQNIVENLIMPLRYQKSFCVQDPFEQCHNVASTITTKLALDIKTFFKFAANAYEKEKVNSCTGFLKTILLEKPKLIRGKTHLEYRVNLFPRIINTIISFDWKTVVRDLVMVMFENMMKIQLGKVEEKVNPDTRKEKEKYMGSLTKPIWKRKKYNALYHSSDLGIEEKQSLISEELIKKEVQPVSLQFQLTLTFCHDPKSAVIAIRMGGGDLDAFREFGKFFISVLQNWFTQLLKPYSMPNCKDTAAKIAETVDGDSNSNEVDSDDDEDEVQADDAEEQASSDSPDSCDAPSGDGASEMETPSIDK